MQSNLLIDTLYPPTIDFLGLRTLSCMISRTLVLASNAAPQILLDNVSIVKRKTFVPSTGMVDQLAETMCQIERVLVAECFYRQALRVADYLAGVGFAGNQIP